MEPVDVTRTLAIMLAAGLAAQVAAAPLRLPPMLLMIAAGAALGPSGLDVVSVPLDSIGAELAFTLGVAFILFHGGLGLSLRVLRRVAVGLSLLAVPGVVLTAVVTGAVAALAFDIPFSHGLLVGAVLAPTDPAILVPLFARLHLRPKVAQTVIAESGVNDPTGAVLALTVASAIQAGDASALDGALDFATELVVSGVLGVGAGLVLALAISSRRPGIWRESAAIAVTAVVAATYAIVDYAGGSGFLGAFLAGLVAGNAADLRVPLHRRHADDMERVVSVAAEIAGMLIFVALGANLPFGDLADDLLPALAVIAALVLVARPLAVLACLLPDRRGGWTREEIAFVAWTRETGVVPAALAGLLVAMDVPDADIVVSCVAVAVVVTLGLQSTSKPAVARRLGLLAEAPARA